MAKYVAVDKRLLSDLPFSCLLRWRDSPGCCTEVLGADTGAAAGPGESTRYFTAKSDVGEAFLLFLVYWVVYLFLIVNDKCRHN